MLNYFVIFMCILNIFLKITVQRPPNLTVMLVWVPLVLLAAVLGYLKRENLHVLFESRYWAALAMVIHVCVC